jgi:hypothetical protein
VTPALKAVVCGPSGEEWATAPDETWFLRNDPWPPLGQEVEACFAGRRPQGSYGKFGYFKMTCVWHGDGDDGSSRWLTSTGEQAAFNPDFWRPLQ